MRETVNIYADGDLDRLAELLAAVAVAEARAAQARSGESRRHGDAFDVEDDAVQEAQAAYNAALDEAAERADAWTVDHIGHTEFRELLKAHPPRKVDVEPEDGETAKQVIHPEDEGLGVNMERFPSALLLYVDPDDPEIRTIVDPEDGVARKVKRLSLGQFQTLFAAAWRANTGGPLDPKATRFSTALTPDATSS